MISSWSHPVLPAGISVLIRDGSTKRFCPLIVIKFPAMDSSMWRNFLILHEPPCTTSP